MKNIKIREIFLNKESTNNGRTEGQKQKAETRSRPDPQARNETGRDQTEHRANQAQSHSLPPNRRHLLYQPDDERRSDQQPESVSQ